MSYRVEILPRAERQAEAARRWWEENRRDAPDLFLEEFEAAITFLSIAPNGAASVRIGDLWFRRHTLPRTRYHLYFQVDDTTRMVLIHAVWSAVRGRRPSLPRK